MLAYFSIILFSTLMDDVEISIIVCTVKFRINYFTVFIYKTYNTIAPVWWEWTDWWQTSILEWQRSIYIQYIILICYYNFTERISQYNYCGLNQFSISFISTVIWILNIIIMYNYDQYSSTVSNIFLLQSMLTIVS